MGGMGGGEDSDNDDDDDDDEVKVPDKLFARVVFFCLISAVGTKLPCLLL